MTVNRTSNDPRCPCGHLIRRHLKSKGREGEAAGHCWDCECAGIQDLILYDPPARLPVPPGTFDYRRKVGPDMQKAKPKVRRP